MKSIQEIYDFAQNFHIDEHFQQHNSYDFDCGCNIQRETPAYKNGNPKPNIAQTTLNMCIPHFNQADTYEFHKDNNISTKRLLERGR